MVSMHVIHKDITIKSQRMIALDKVIRMCMFKFRILVVIIRLIFIKIFIIT